MSERPPQTYVDAALGRMPRWMRGTWFDRVWTSTFGTLDTVATLAKHAARAGMIETCPDDAVERHARARHLYRAPGETIAALRERVAGAWDFWATLSKPANLEAALNVYAGLTGSLHLYDQARDNWLGGAVGGSFYDDANTDNASRHAIVIETPHPWARPTIGTGLVVGPDLLVGIDMTGVELSGIRAAYRRHRPANMVGIDIYVVFDSTTGDDILGAHDASGDYVRMPLHCAMVGYVGHGMTVGPAMVVGQQFT